MEYSKVLILIIWAAFWSVIRPCQGQESGIATLTSQTKTLFDYADFLLADQDYYRAISTLKYLHFISADSSIRTQCNYKIGVAYFYSQRYETSIKYLSKTLVGSANQRYLYRANLYMGFNYQKLDSYDKAKEYLQVAEDMKGDGASSLFIGLTLLKQGQVHRAVETYRYINQTSPDTNVIVLSANILSILDKQSRISPRSPHVAALLSSVLPGAGQVYSHHYYDGVQAFVLVTSFVYTAVISYKYFASRDQNQVTTAFSIGIASLFHYANIIGAAKTARYRNMRDQKVYSSSVENLLKGSTVFSSVSPQISQ